MPETFTPLKGEEFRTLRKALYLNGNDKAVLLTDRDTSFVGTSEEIPDAEVVSAIKSVPTHY